jgi:hypothetical protein
MNSREQTDAMSAAILWPSASVDKRGSCAPKGQNKIAQGFNPGLVAPVRFALKGRQIRRDRLRFHTNNDAHPPTTFWCHFQGTFSEDCYPRAKALGYDV